MDPDLAHYCALLETRLEVMRRLAAALEQGHAAVLAMDLDRCERHTAEQQALCDQLRVLEDQVKAEHESFTAAWGGEVFPADAVAPGGVAAGERWRALLEQSRQVQARVRYLNRIHGALLRRARRSLAVLANLLASSAVTYAPPGSAQNAASGPQFRT